MQQVVWCLVLRRGVVCQMLTEKEKRKKHLQKLPDTSILGFNSEATEREAADIVERSRLSVPAARTRGGRPRVHSPP